MGYMSPTVLLSPSSSIFPLLFLLGPSITYVTLFLANLDPPSLCHTVTHPGTPKSTSHILNPPILVGLVQKTRTTAPCTNSLSIVLGGLLSERFCPRRFLSVPPSVRIGLHLLQQKVKHHFKFNVSYVR